MDGIDKLKAAIEADRNPNPPSVPVILCGTPDGTERRVDEWSSPPYKLPLKDRVLNWLVAPIARIMGF